MRATLLYPATVVVLLLAWGQPLAWGGGFEISAQAAQATGQAEAYVAQADGPPAAFYNPGGLTLVPGTQVTGGVYTVFTGFEFQSSSAAVSPGGATAVSDETAYVPHLYAVSDLGSSRWRVGLAANTVFGLTLDWGEDSPLQSFVTHSDLAVYNVAPVVAYEVDEHLSLGGGLNVYHGNLELDSRPLLPVVGPSDFRFQGDDTALGATAGVLYRINRQHALGLVYRSPFTLDFDGSVAIYPQAGGAIKSDDAQASLDFPQILVLGYAYRPVSRLKLEADIQWADWATLDQVQIQSPDPRLSALRVIPFDWRSSFTYRLGVQYELQRFWTLRAGYFYSSSASPNETFSAAVVDLDSHVFAAGVGYHRTRWAVDVAYRYIVGQDRDIGSSANSPPGRYSDLTQTVMLSVTYRF